MTIEIGIAIFSLMLTVMLIAKQFATPAPMSEIHYSELMARVRYLEDHVKDLTNENAEMRVIIALFLSKQDDEESELEKDEIKRRARAMVSSAKDTARKMSK